MKHSMTHRKRTSAISSTPSMSENRPTRPNVKPRIYIRRITLTTKSGALRDVQVWMGRNPVGCDWSLGCVGIYTLEEAMTHYHRNLRRVGIREVQS